MSAGTDPLLPADVRHRLATARAGRRLYYFPETDSTNDVAIDLARRGEPEGAVVYTEFQRRGRGRRERDWNSPRGRDLLFSLLLRPPGSARDALPLALAASVAVSDALGSALETPVGVKWPNDVVHAGRKLAGILCEAGEGSAGRHVVVGIGVNVNSGPADLPQDLRATAVSCRTIAGAPLDRAALFASLLEALETIYGRFRAGGFAVLREEYEHRLAWAGRRVAFDREGREETGRVTGVADDGALRVQSDGGPEVLLYGETVREVVE